MALLDDSSIVNLYFCRDEAAICATREKYGCRLRALSENIVQDAQTAEECEDDTYIQAWNSIPPNEPREYLYPFLARIIRHISLNCCRSRNSLKRSAFICELSSEMEQCIPAPDDCESRLNDMDLRDVINRFLNTISTEKRRIFLRRYWFLDSITDISQRYAISESKVKVTLLRCRNQFRVYLEREGYTL